MSTGELVSAVRPTSGLAREGPGRSQRAFVNETSPASCSDAAKHLRCAFFWLLASVLDAASCLCRRQANTERTLLYVSLWSRFVDYSWRIAAVFAFVVLRCTSCGAQTNFLQPVVFAFDAGPALQH